MLRKTVSVLLVTTSLSLATFAPPAHAGDGGAVAAGIFGGLAAGTLLGIAATTPRYGPPPPMYGWVYPRVRVCESILSSLDPV